MTESEVVSFEQEAKFVLYDYEKNFWRLRRNMDSTNNSTNNSANGSGIFEDVFCPLFDRVIDSGLCWEISNIGNDSLMLRPEETPPCGWDKSYETCKVCPEYLAMD